MTTVEVPHDTGTISGKVAAVDRAEPRRGVVVNERGELEWDDWRFPAVFVLLGIVAAIGVAGAPGERPVFLAVALVLLAVSPWFLSFFGKAPSDVPFVCIVEVPIGILIVLGEALDLVDLDGGAPQLILMLLIGIVGQVAAAGSKQLLTGTVVGALAIVVGGSVVRGDPLDFAPWAVGIFLAVVGGRAFRSSVLRMSELRAAQQAIADQQLVDERRRIAREVHDIVAHTMSVTMLHLTAARLALEEDPAAAEEALLEAERNGRASMEDIRRVVRLLRADESSLAAALPDDADVLALVERYRAAGGDITLSQSGDPGALAPGARLAVYRVMQESLSNAVRHGTGSIQAALDSTDDFTDVVVTNDASLTDVGDPGAGLTGMAERVAALDGTLEFGPDESRARWRVHARIPT